MQNYFDNEATSSTLHATMKPARGGKCLVTLSTYEDRKEALLNTTLMDDAGIYRSMGTKTNITSEDRHKNETVDNRESKQEAHSHIPKPPPPQMSGNSNPHNSNHSPQTSINATKSCNKSLGITETSSTARLSNSSQNSNSNLYPGNEAQSRYNKTTPTTVANNLHANRQTLRLGTVTIGEYHQPSMRREPEKFNFISTQKRTRDTGGETLLPTNEALQSELQNTLTRANLRKSNGNSSYTEHQRNCPLHHQQQQLQQRQSVDYSSNGFTVEEVTKKLQKSSLNENSSTANNRSANHTNGTTGVGILKNGNRNGTSSSSSKSIEKSIKFG